MEIIKKTFRGSYKKAVAVIAPNNTNVIRINKKTDHVYLTQYPHVIMYAQNLINKHQSQSLGELQIGGNISVLGGGLTGQMRAIKLAISKYIASLSQDHKLILRSAGCLTTINRYKYPNKLGQDGKFKKGIKRNRR